MFGLFERNSWPEPTFDEVKKRARLLAIDDEGFAYKALFARDGYTMEEWPDVQDLQKIENNYFDLILLDVQGVGKELSSEQGLGVLQHIRRTSPAQIVIAFSNSDYSLKYQDFFRMADATLSKGADYVDFKRQVDELLKARFTLGFYLNKIDLIAGSTIDDPAILQKEARKAILSGNAQRLKRYLGEKISDPKTIEMAGTIAELAIKIAAAWKV